MDDGPISSKRIANCPPLPATGSTELRLGGSWLHLDPYISRLAYLEPAPNVARQRKILHQVLRLMVRVESLRNKHLGLDSMCQNLSQKWTL